jgi:branched-chain amino acid transport system ATP-binding protein
MNQAPILTGQHVSKSFGSLRAVDDVDFEVHAGEILGIIGPNGAGKTTLLSLINGTLPVSQGKISFRGKQISGRKPHQIASLGISRTFQIVKPFPGMTALENVALGALFGRNREADMSRAMERAAETLKRVRIEGKEDVLVEKLNVSERKRLELARALTQNPDLLLLDEVMAGLTPREIEDIMALIQEVRREGNHGDLEPNCCPSPGSEDRGRDPCPDFRESTGHRGLSRGEVLQGDAGDLGWRRKC